MYLEGNIISFTELGERYIGIIVEKRDDSSLIVFDIYGSIKTIYREDVISTDVEMNINSVNNLLKYYKYHLEQKNHEDIIINFQRELREIKERYAEKISIEHRIIDNLNDAKLELIDNLDVYAYAKMNEKFEEILNSNEKGYEICTDYKHSLKAVVFNRLYTLKEEGTFDVEKLDFISYFSNGEPYTQQPEFWSNQAKIQAKNLIKKIDKELGLDQNVLYLSKLEIEDRIIFGGVLKDLTLERNYKFIPKNLTNQKEEIDKVFYEIADFAKEFILEKNNEDKYPWQEGYESKENSKVLIFPWRDRV